MQTMLLHEVKWNVKFLSNIGKINMFLRHLCIGIEKASVKESRRRHTYVKWITTLQCLRDFKFSFRYRWFWCHFVTKMFLIGENEHLIDKEKSWKCNSGDEACSLTYFYKSGKKLVVASQRAFSRIMLLSGVLRLRRRALMRWPLLCMFCNHC